MSDSEVITMEIVAEYQGIDTDKGIWQYFQRYWQSWFPHLTSRSAFTLQAANLWQGTVARGSGHPTGSLPRRFVSGHGIPILLCCFSRAPRCRSFQGQADYGYCVAKKQTYYGFHGHLLISSMGVITSFTLTPANGSEREALWEMVGSIEGLLIGDKGYVSQTLRQDLQDQGLELQTALRSNMDDTRGAQYLRLLKHTRRLIETVIGQLTERFHIEKVWARDLWHLTSLLNWKILAHTVCCWLNRNS